MFTVVVIYGLLTILMITVMTYEMPKLPYTNNALEPVISQQTIDYQVVHIGLQMFTVVVIYGLLTDYRFQCIVGVGKFWHRTGTGYHQ